MSALRILKERRRHGTCRDCRHAITWATSAPKGKAITLVATPFVLREETSDRGVVFEVLGWDQVHRCATQRRGKRTKRPVSTSTPDRLQQLRAALDQPPARTSPAEAGTHDARLF